MAIPNTRPLTRPARDEWGVYDPQQAGIAALVARLDAREAAAASQAEPTERTEPAPAAKRPTLGDAQ